MRCALTTSPSRSNTFVGSVLLTSTTLASMRGRSTPGCSAPSVEPSTWNAPVFSSNSRARKTLKSGATLLPDGPTIGSGALRTRLLAHISAGRSEV